MGGDFRGKVEDHGSRVSDEDRMGLAHDFRNLLQLATSAIRITRSRLLESPVATLADTLKDALDAIDRANLLAHRLSSVRPQDGEAGTILLQTLLPELRSLLSHTLGKGIRLETLVSQDLPPIPCKQDALENALFNLALNARDAMSGGGVLIMEARRCCVGSHCPACVTVSVTDTGEGMSRETAEQVFLRFFTTKLRSGGSGLGLYNVRNFAESLGGSVELRTSRGAGTRVQLHLPGIVPAAEG